MNSKIVCKKNDHDIKVNQHQIIFSYSFDKPLRKYHIVDYLTHGSHYNNRTKCLNIPFDVTEMIFGNWYNKDLIVFPNINHLHFGHNFNQPIVLGANVVTVQFGEKFNSSITLNRRVMELDVGDRFDQNICLNKQLKKIKFGSRFNKHVLLNRDLEHVLFDNCMYDQPMSLGPNIKVLVIKSYNYIHKVFLTKQITHLTFADANCANIKLPKHLKYLSLTPFMLKMVTLGKHLQSLKIFYRLSDQHEPMLILEKKCCKNDDYISIQMHAIQVRNYYYNHNGHNYHDELEDCFWGGGIDDDFYDNSEPEFLSKYIVENLSNGVKYKIMGVGCDMIILNE